MVIVFESFTKCHNYEHVICSSNFSGKIIARYNAATLLCSNDSFIYITLSIAQHLVQAKGVVYAYIIYK